MKTNVSYPIQLTAPCSGNPDGLEPKAEWDEPRSPGTSPPHWRSRDGSLTHSALGSLLSHDLKGANCFLSDEEVESAGVPRGGSGFTLPTSASGFPLLNLPGIRETVPHFLPKRQHLP